MGGFDGLATMGPLNATHERFMESWSEKKRTNTNCYANEMLCIGKRLGRNAVAYLKKKRLKKMILNW